MDALAFVISILFFAGYSLQFPQGDLQTLDVAAESSKNYTKNANGTLACETARGLVGSCVDRQFCEYSTSAIDLTLYAPRGYKKALLLFIWQHEHYEANGLDHCIGNKILLTLCAEKETCCPFSFQLSVETNKNNWEDQDLSFDDKK